MSDASDCTCKTHEKPEHLSLPVRGLEHKIGARFTADEARQIIKYCAGNACSQSEAFRRAVALLARESGDPEAKLDAVAKALGLDPKAASPEALTAALDDLIARAFPIDAPAGATGGGADTPPPGSAFRRELSKAERAYCAKHKLTPEQFAARTRERVARR
jgi:hypothetical protein